MRKGEVYQHYKNNNYTFLGITTPVVENFIDWELVVKYYAINEATKESVEVYEYKDGVDRFIFFVDLPVQHVLYESHQDGQLWLRNPADFFGPITRGSQLRFRNVGE